MTERQAMKMIRKGKPVAVNCFSGELEEGGSRRAHVRDINDDIKTIKDLKRAATAEIERWEKELNDLKHLIDTAEYCKNAYFWQPGSNARERERQDERYTTDAGWTEGGHDWVGQTVMDQHCTYVAFWTRYWMDDERTTLRAVKNSYKRLKKIHDPEGKIF